jgi:integrase
MKRAAGVLAITPTALTTTPEGEGIMSFDSLRPRHVNVWVQEFRGRKYLQIQWHDPHTGERKTRSTETNDPKRAEEQRAALEYELNHGLYGVQSELGWDKFRSMFEAEYVAARRPNTQRFYAATLDLFEQLCRPRKLRLVTERTVSAFAAGLRQLPIRGGRVGCAASTIDARLRFLHTALNWAAGQKLLAACPRFPAVKVPRKRPQPVPAEAFERLLAVAPDAQTRAYLLCGWLAGLRRSEAAELEWGANGDAPYLDLVRDRIVLPAEFAKAAEDQWVPLDPDLKAALLALPRRGRKVFRFVARDGHRVTADALGWRVRALARKAGVKLTMHTLRKGFGCRYAATESAHVLQRLMRHSSISITMGYYACIDDAVEQAVKGKRAESSPLRNTLRKTGVPDGEDGGAACDANPDASCTNT